MSGGGEAEESDGRPGVGRKECVHVGHQHDRRDAERADEESELATGVDAVSVLHTEAGEPSAGDRAETGGGIDDDEGILDVVQVQAVVVVEELWEIKEVKPPDGVGDAFCYEKSPEAAMAEENGVERAALGDGGKVDLGLGSAAAEPVVRKEKPDDEPNKPHGAGADEGGVPSPTQGDGCDEDRRDEGGGVGTRVEETRCEGTLFGGEPFGGGLNGRGEVAGFAEAEEGATDHEADDAADERSADGGASPDEDGEGIAGLGSEFVDDAAGEEEADAVSDLEGDENSAVVDVVGGLVGVIESGNPAHEVEVKERLDEREDRAVHVVDSGSEEEKTADGPSKVRFFRGGGGEARAGGAGGLNRQGANSRYYVGLTRLW